MNKTQVSMIFGGVALIVMLIFANNLVENVEKGTYHIKQAAVSGKMTAHKNTGWYMQLFGTVTVWPNAETFFFTMDKDPHDDINEDRSFQVRFNDGSLAHISGTCRVTLPVSDRDSIDLTNKHSYASYRDVEYKAVLPVVREAVRNTANFMSARESYSERRSDFVFLAKDQAINGIYLTEKYTEKVKDPVSGELVTKTYTRIKKDDSGNPVREPNLLKAMGITLSNFEIKDFRYEKKVISQIEKQQESQMAVATAKVKAQQAEQEAITKEAEGKARVMEAKYKMEEDKIRAIVEAEKEKEVAELGAAREKEVARLNAEKAEEEARRIKTLADADLYEKEKQAEGRKALIVADGALKQKLDAFIETQKVWADAYSTRKVPSVVMGGSDGQGGTDNDVSNFMQILGVKAAQDLALDMKIQNK